jgi:hypothetical protein
MFNCKIRNSRDFKVESTSYHSHNAVVLNKVASSNVSHHIHTPNVHGISTPRIPTPGGNNKEAQKFLVLSSAFGSSHKQTSKRESKETVKITKLIGL